MITSGVSSVGICVPKNIRTNDYYLNHPSANVQQSLEVGLGRLWNKLPGVQDPFSIEMESYLNDPFRGSKERRVMESGQTSLLFETQAARNALSAAKMSSKDIDAIIVTSFLPDRVGAGNAAYLAKELETRCPAWNLESACSSGIVALEVANALIKTGTYRTLLIVQSCNYAQTVVDEDPSSWFVGDGAGALVVTQANTGYGFLGFHVESTNETCGVVTYRVNGGKNQNEPNFVLENIRGAGKILQETSLPHLLSCCHTAALKSNVNLQEIDFFIFSTPTAWYAASGARALNVSSGKTISTHEKYGNIGPAMLMANLYEAISKGKVKHNDQVLIYQIGSVSNAAAAVMRCDHIALVASEL